jgi:hypothetical protein
MKLLSILLLASSTAFAFPQEFLASADDVIAIVYSREVIAKLGPNKNISAIVRIGPEQFEISAGACTLQVRVIRVSNPNEPVPMVPERRVEIGQMRCS